MPVEMDGEGPEFEISIGGTMTELTQRLANVPEDVFVGNTGWLVAQRLGISHGKFYGQDSRDELSALGLEIFGECRPYGHTYDLFYRVSIPKGWDAASVGSQISFTDEGGNLRMSQSVSYSSGKAHITIHRDWPEEKIGHVHMGKITDRDE